jgi:hypothetical protein
MANQRNHPNREDGLEGLSLRIFDQTPEELDNGQPKSSPLRTPQERRDVKGFLVQLFFLS